MDDYNGNDFALDVLAGMFAESDAIMAEQGEQAWMDHVFDNAPTVGGLWISLLEAGYTDAEINAEIHMRQYTDQGFTTITFDE